MIRKEFLKREIGSNNTKFYPMSKEMKHTLKIQSGRINIKIVPRRKYDREMEKDRKCIRIVVENENMEDVKGMVHML